MERQQENTPLLVPQAYPLFQGGKSPASSYGVVEMPPGTEGGGTTYQNIDNPPNRHSQSQGIITSPIVAIIALVVAFVLIFSLTMSGSGEQKVILGSGRVLRQSAVPRRDTNTAATAKEIGLPQGRLGGVVRKSRQGRDYAAYYKVPYAEPPLGELRFKDPVPPRTTWTGLRSTPIVAPQCIQKEKYSDIVHAVGEEDCLYANIYVPSNPTTTENLPVMVYIHGGGFTDGNGSRYGADYFMDEDVIVVTFQYRLGAFGYLNTQDDVIHGNMGFKDQVQMLVWTRDNIEYFGGDPNRVTIYGNSAGGMCVGFQMVSPMATGLFHRAISQSGGSACSGPQRMLDLDPMKTVQEVGRELNCTTQDSTAFLDCLRTKDAAAIALVRSSNTTYSLTLENRDDAEVFMPDTPYRLLTTNPNKVPHIVGVVKDEWAGQGLVILMFPELVKNLNADFPKYGKDVLNINMTAEELSSVKDFYFGDREIGNSTFREIISMVSDPGMIHCSYLTAKLHADFSPSYLYQVSKPPAKSYVDKAIPDFPAKDLGIVSHADELQYLFLYDGYPEIPNGDPEYFEFSRDMVHLWTTFAADGAPPAEWEQVSASSSSIFWYNLNDTSSRTEALRDRMNFWDGFSHKTLGYDH